MLKVVNFAARVVTGLRKFDHISRARNQLCFMVPRQMHDLYTLTAAHKILVSGEPSELASLFQCFSDARNCDRPTRQDGRLRPPAFRTMTGQRSFSYRAVTLLNRLPIETRALGPSAFKRAAKSLVLQ